jgi:hypothetical protein
MRRRSGPVSEGFSPRWSAVAAAAALLLAVTASGCGTGSAAPATRSGPAVSTAAASTGQRIVVRFGDAVVPATLADTTAGREFAALLPLTLDLRDPMGQAKSGRLPAPVNSTGEGTTADPDAGGIYYVPGSQTLAVFYDDLGQAVPAPGLVRLGAVDGDLTPVASAGNRVTARLDLADSASS